MLSEFKKKALADIFKDKNIVYLNVSDSFSFLLDRFFSQVSNTFASRLNLKTVEELKACFSNHSETILIIENRNNEFEWDKAGELLKTQALDGKVYSILISMRMERSFLKKWGDVYIDLVLAKPLSIQMLSEEFLANQKKMSSRKATLKVIKTAKILLETKELVAAENVLKKSLMSEMDYLAPRQCLLGKVYYLQGKFKDSINSYLAALKATPDFYEGLQSLYSLFKQVEDIDNSYNTLKRIFATYPATTQEYCDAIRFCLQIKRLEDFAVLLHIYGKMRIQDETAKKYTTAAITAYTRYLLEKNEISDAYKMAIKLVSLNLGHLEGLKSIFQKLLELGLKEEMLTFLELFPEYDRSSETFALCRFYSLVLNKSKEHTLEYGQELINKGLQDLILYETVLAALEMKGDLPSVKILKDKIATLWPASQLKK